VPLYVYACPDCGKAFDLLQKFSDPPATICPGCGGGNVHKKLSAPAFHLKGGGWYKDHYGLKSSGGDSGGSSASEGGSSSGSPSSASSVPAAPPAASAPASTGGTSAGSS